MKVEVVGKRLRLRWTYQGRRYALAVGLPNTKVNRTFAQQKASQIELDIISGNFDDTLKKYKPKQTSHKHLEQITAGEVFEKFMTDQEKEKGLQVGSLCRYTGVLRQLQRFFKDKPVEYIGVADTGDFAAHLKEHCSDRTTKDYLILIRACWDWGRLKHLIEFNANPWDAVLDRVKVAPKQRVRVKPFTAAEVKAIESTFRHDRYYAHYADFVTFLFGTGCRFGEAAGLQWQHVADDFQTVWFGESVSRGVRKTTKTGKARTIILTPKITKLLADRKSKSYKSEDLVFLAPKGGPINDHTFRRRAWKGVLSKTGIEYRKPYATRHTVISHPWQTGLII